MSDHAVVYEDGEWIVVSDGATVMACDKGTECWLSASDDTRWEQVAAALASDIYCQNEASDD